MGVVHRLEVVQIHEEQRRRLVCPAAPQKGMLETLQHQRPVRRSCQRIVQRRFARAVCGVLEVLPRLGVEQVRGGDVGERLGCAHGTRGERPRRIAVEVERPKTHVVVIEREREHGRQPVRKRPWREGRELLIAAQIRDRDGQARVVGSEARSLVKFGLQPFKDQRCVVRCGDVAGLEPWSNQRHPCPGDRKNVDDALHQVIEDALNREVRRHRARELAEHADQIAFVRQGPACATATPRLLSRQAALLGGRRAAPSCAVASETVVPDWGCDGTVPHTANSR